MSKNLVIVESPAKAKTIKKFLSEDFDVKSSFGHIRDLPKKNLNIDVEDHFKPHYEVSSDKKKIVKELKQSAKDREVWLASDEDREGEAIAWHLTQAMKLDPTKTKRIVFHEITKPAIEHAINNPRKIDINLVDSYQARRVLDRLVGYEISPILWRKVRPGLSAGRVQSVGVRLVVDREREIRTFQPVSSFKVSALFSAENYQINSEMTNKLSTIEEVRELLKIISQMSFFISSISKKPANRNPSPPFTTSTLQQEASRRLGFSVRQTMSLAQRLYENGFITYMRTDSTTLSALALEAAGSYINSKFGKDYYERRQYKTKIQNAQEAHEAIRPTNFNNDNITADEQEQRLYKLIWQRTLASQMAPALMEKTEITIAISDRTETFLTKGEVLKFDGFLRVYGNAKEDVILPQVKKNQILKLDSIKAIETFSHPPARYSEATLVKKLEELGVGRPSTYASIISTIQSRGYVEKTDIEGVKRSVRQVTVEDGQLHEELLSEITGADNKKLIPTHLAEITSDFISKYFSNIVDYDFTAKTEAELDGVAKGKTAWSVMVDSFYKKFHPMVGVANEASRKEVSQSRLIGKDPKTNQPIYARFGRYGPMLQLGEVEDKNKPSFAPLPKNAKIETVTLAEALEMFKLPRIVGKTVTGQEIKANIGRFGPYIQVDSDYVSIKEPLDPLTITETEAQKLYTAKLEKNAQRIIHRFSSGIQILNGPYGPYVTDGKKNARISKEQKPEKLTELECKQLLAKSSSKKRRFNNRHPKTKR